MTIQIETARLNLRQFKQADTNELHNICNQEYVLKWMPDWGVSVENLKEGIKWFEKCYLVPDPRSIRIMLAVSLKTDGKIIGLVGIGPKEEVDNEIEIAYYISEEYCNQGFISEAAKAMTEWVFNNTEIEYLIAIVELDNFPSQRVVEKGGFSKLETKMIQNSGDTEVKPFFYYRLYKKDVMFSS
ncbi:MAG TPA: GNAT family N-acetyltransferase [Clostridia bacterium]|nr:GNAT family N-acetyltransferase [Clostridia bacterium]